MKKFIYMWLVAAILVGCKGNSFLTQRYTNYSHHVAKTEKQKHKASRAQLTVAKQEVAVQEVKKEEITTPANGEAQTQSMPVAARLVKQVAQLPKKYYANNFNAGKQVVNQNESNHFDSKCNTQTIKKVEKANKHSAFKAFIGKILKIIVLILTIAMLLIVVFILVGLGII